MNIIFIAGTDTGVGKTVVAGLLSRYLLEKGYRVVTQKWVQTGCKGFSSDIDIHLRFMRKKRDDYQGHLCLMMPYVFQFASSPHLAAGSENKRIGVSKIKKCLKALSSQFDFVIVEGVGGLCVPLNAQTMLIDVVKEMNLPVLLVVGNRLGAINHALLSIEALRSRKIKTLGMIFNNVAEGENRTILKNNPRIIKKVSGENLLGILPRMKSPYELQRQFNRIGAKILNQYG